jgi:serine/threonine-protein kinase
LTKYDVLEELGHGGMATVYRAHDRRLGRDVAVKVLHPHLRESTEIAHRFSVEARAVAKLRHPNIVEVFDVSSEDDVEQYLVVELVRGPTMRKLLQERGVFPPEIAACFVLEVLAGIAHAHDSGVIHRDVKPENVLIEHRKVGGGLAARAPDDEAGLVSTPVPSTSRAPANPGERIAVKLTDFGIAKLLDAQGVTSTGQVLGSPAHMAPEQIEGGEVDGRADIFGLGVLLYECMVGHLPFLGNNPAQVLRRVLDGTYASAERERPTLGKVWSLMLDRALARKAENRFPDAIAMRDAVAAELKRLGVGTPRVELEAWLDDPDAWTKTHEARIIDRLCRLGAASRKSGDAVSAAADYNRALAYAPNDPSLLRIVASMHRSEARARLFRRVAPLVLGAGVLGSGAYLVAKTVKGGTRDVTGPKSMPSVSTSLIPTETQPSATVADVQRRRPSGVLSSAAGPASAPTHVIATPTIAITTKVGTLRTIRFASLRPPFGVHMTIDGTAAADPVLDGIFSVDEKAHALVFTCAADACEPKTVMIPAGEASDPLAIELTVPPARLVIEGEPGRSYGIEELPNLNIQSGQEATVPMMSTSSRQVTVFDRNDPTRKTPVTLHAGKQVVQKAP